MIKEVNISKFSLPNGFTFNDSYAFYNDEMAFLINKDLGTTILLTLDLFEEILDKKPSEDLQEKLVQRFIGTLCNKELHIDESKKIYPKYFMINVTSKCNLRCLYCFRKHNSERIITQEETYKICKYILNYCKKYKIDRISLQPWGGEPLIAYERILEIDDFFKKNGLNCNIYLQTNGTLLSKEKSDELVKRNIHVGFSIDGIKEINDSQRIFLNGNGTYDYILKGIDNILNSGCRGIGAISVITSQNIEYIETSIRYFLDKLKLGAIKCNPVKLPLNCSIKSLSSERLEKLGKELVRLTIKLRKEGYDFIESNVKDRLNNLSCCYRGSICNSHGCQGGRKMISFDCDGNIYPCEMVDYPEEIIGSISDEKDLIDMISSAVEKKDYFIVKKSNKCQDCPWQPYCKGGCTTALRYTGSNPESIDENECAFNRGIYCELVRQILESYDDFELLKRRGGNK